MFFGYNCEGLERVAFQSGKTGQAYHTAEDGLVPTYERDSRAL
jgi:hypothetical protein